MGNRLFFYQATKRLGDILGALLGLLLLSPVFLALALAVRLSSPGPVLHRRRVLALQSDPETKDTLLSFDAFKFRTMRLDADSYLVAHPELMAEYQKEFKLRDDPRVTPLGRWLRRSSLDELPQLVNVLLGQMSLVGPRMISPPERERYGKQVGKLLSVPPGLTGLWQVSGRQELSYPQRVALDMEYIDRRSVWLDLMILVRTVAVVVMRRGAF